MYGLRPWEMERLTLDEWNSVTQDLQGLAKQQQAQGRGR